MQSILRNHNGDGNDNGTMIFREQKSTGYFPFYFLFLLWTRKDVEKRFEETVYK